MPLTLPSYPLINGVLPDWSCIQFTPQLPDGSASQVVGIKSISYKLEQDPADVFGTGQTPVGITKGTMKFSGDVEMYIKEFYALVDALGPGFTNIPITITVAYSVGDFTRTDTLLGCRMLAPEASQSQGADALTRKMTLKMLGILFDGIAPGDELAASVS